MQHTTTTKSEQIKAALGIIAAVAETIRELGQIPSGSLYVNMMGKISLEDYNKIIRTLKGAGLVSESSNLLTWIGPKLEAR